MNAEKEMETRQREIVEEVRVLMGKKNFQTSSPLYFGDAGPYLLAMRMENQQEVFYGCEFIGADELETNTKQIAAAFTDADFVLDAIQTMNLPAADRSFESITLLSQTIIVNTMHSLIWRSICAKSQRCLN